MRQIVLTRPGGPDKLALLDAPSPEPGPGEVLVEVVAAGVNFMDLGVADGTVWRETPLPRPMGVEGAGRVLSVGESATRFQPGQRVAWVYAPGSYAERIAIAEDRLVGIPDAIDDRTAAAMMMQGLTAHHFATDFYPVQPGDVALVHATAGGVGLLLTQIVRRRGGTVIGRVSSEEKATLARSIGADHVIVDHDGRFADEVLRLTGGRGVDVVYDGSGLATFQGSLDSLRRMGVFCWYGPILAGAGTIDLFSLPRSIKIGYASFMDHVTTPDLLRWHAAELFGWVANGGLKITVGGAYRLEEAATALTEMQARRTTGKLLLLP